MATKSGFFAYLKQAFIQHWNLLALGAGTAAGIISGHADIVLPIVAGAELVYLAGLASHPKFQRHVDAQAHKDARQEATEQVTAPTLQRIYTALDPRSRARFESLRRRCREMRQLAQGVGGPQELRPVDELQSEGINKLLWVFLKLLYSKRSLERFLERTDEQEIRGSVADLEQRIAALGPEAEDTPEEARRRRSLVDTLASANLRLENLRKARDNCEFINLEVERIDNKITSIAELAVNRQDPDFITSEVDGMAASMEQTEQAMSELQFIAGIESSAAAPPPSFLDEQLDVQ